MTAFDRDPERNRIANLSSDPGAIAVADQNKAAALKLLRENNDFFLAIPTDDELIVVCGLRGRDLPWFAAEILEALATMTADYEEEIS